MSSRSNDSAPSGTISADVAARLIKVSPRRLRQLVGEGWIPKAAYGRYTVVGVVHGYLGYRDDLEQRRSTAASDNDLRAVRRREIEQRMAMRDRELIDIVEHDAVFDEAFGMSKAELVGLPARITRERAMRNHIESEIDGVLNRAAARFEQATSQLRETGKAAVPAEEDDAG